MNGRASVRLSFFFLLLTFRRQPSDLARAFCAPNKNQQHLFMRTPLPSIRALHCSACGRQLNNSTSPTILTLLVLLLSMLGWMGTATEAKQKQNKVIKTESDNRCEFVPKSKPSRFPSVPIRLSLLDALLQCCRMGHAILSLLLLITALLSVCARLRPAQFVRRITLYM